MERRDAGELFARCAAERDERSWRELLQRFRGPILAGIRRALALVGAAGNRWEIEDLWQEVLCCLLEDDARRLRRCRAARDAAAAGYLQRVAYSVVVDALRRGLAERRGGGRVLPVAGRRSLLVALRRVADVGPGPEDRLLAAEHRALIARRVRAAVAGPGGRQRARVVEMAVLDGLSSHEIAERFDHRIRPGTVDSLVYRARCRLRRQGVELPARR